MAFGALFVIAGLAVAARAGTIETRAAGEQAIPLWLSADYRRPRGSMLMLALAALLVGVGACFFLPGWGPIAVALQPLVFVPPFVVVALHNRSVRADASSID